MNEQGLLKKIKIGLSGLAQMSDIGFVLFVVAIIALMILPLSPAIIDALVACSMCSGIVILMMAIYIKTPLDFSSYPSVLLIVTLYRLSLSIATTRMILLKGEAGDIIQSFGSFVAGGDLVVGLVVFLIITVVQFLVIAKGAERVAEVSARFTLDAMPGKQMSIDSDLRAGLIDKLDARAKRKTLEQESQLHGNLDGAMKFVKGDAIAGIIIVFINLLGGLIIGIVKMHMSFGDAIAHYSILSIGDGMVTQIPALLAAMSAGLIVTRAEENANASGLGVGNLATLIQRQFGAQPRIFLVTSGLCVLFALIPGFPSIVFLFLAAISFLIGLKGTPNLSKQIDQYLPWQKSGRSAGFGEDPLVWNRNP